ncbi:MAG: LLM class flavin-dependent oxidoreductase, partial [Cyanobacteria bacterium J06623_5]
ASGDRPAEYPALNQPFTERGDRFRDSFDYIRRMGESTPSFDNRFGHLGNGMDMLPKPFAEKLPLLITGSSRQGPEWIVQHGDGWITYPRNLAAQEQLIRAWQDRVTTFGRAAKPVMQPLYIDLTEDAEAPPRPIHLGFQLGIKQLRSYLKLLEKIGVNHVALNLRFNQANTEATLKRLADDILPEFTL